MQPSARPGPRGKATERSTRAAQAAVCGAGWRGGVPAAGPGGGGRGARGYRGGQGAHLVVNSAGISEHGIMNYELYSFLF